MLRHWSQFVPNIKQHPRTLIHDNNQRRWLSASSVRNNNCLDWIACGNSSISRKWDVTDVKLVKNWWLYIIIHYTTGMTWSSVSVYSSSTRHWMLISHHTATLTAACQRNLQVFSSVLHHRISSSNVFCRLWLHQKEIVVLHPKTESWSIAKEHTGSFRIDDMMRSWRAQNANCGVCSGGRNVQAPFCMLPFFGSVQKHINTK